jgi:hypothetical protein
MRIAECRSRNRKGSDLLGRAVRPGPPEPRIVVIPRFAIRVCSSYLRLKSESPEKFLDIIGFVENLEFRDDCQIRFEICFLRSKEYLLVSEF